MAKTSSYRDTANLGFGDPPRALSAAPAVWGPPMDVSAGPDPAGGGGGGVSPAAHLGQVPQATDKIQPRGVWQISNYQLKHGGATCRTRFSS